MTREEASIILKNMDRILCDDDLNEAFDIAIKALEQELVLDKIRAEIQEYADKRKDSLFGDGLRQALEIIDKYKAESEP